MRADFWPARRRYVACNLSGKVHQKRLTRLNLFECRWGLLELCVHYGLEGKTASLSKELRAGAMREVFSILRLVAEHERENALSECALNLADDRLRRRFESSTAATADARDSLRCRSPIARCAERNHGLAS